MIWRFVVDPDKSFLCRVQTAATTATSVLTVVRIYIHVFLPLALFRLIASTHKVVRDGSAVLGLDCSRFRFTRPAQVTLSRRSDDTLTEPVDSLKIELVDAFGNP